MKTIRPFTWSLRRELWENRSLTLAPLAVAVLILAASLVGTIALPAKLADPSLGAAQRQDLIEQPYTFAALLLMFTTMVVGVFYCIDALQGERRDRSILFWKSMPVSDFTAVAAKASVPFVVIPLVTFAVTVATQAAMMLLGSARMLGSAQSAALWSHVSLWRMWAWLFYHLLGLHSLWWAPFWGWLLLASAWARRSAFLWATLPPLAIGLLEKIAFHTSHFGAMLSHRFMGGPDEAGHAGHEMTIAALTPLKPGEFLRSPGLWTGLLIGAAFLAAAVRLRRSRESS